MRSIKHFSNWIVGLAALSIVACSKDHYQYDKYVQNGPLVYPGRPDTVQALAGRERIQLKWPVPSDLNIVGYKVYWNFGTDSLVLDGRKNGSGDSIQVFLNNMPQGAYSFNVYAYDKAGNRSVATQTLGNVYGGIFASTVFNRPISGMVKKAAVSTLEVAWVGLDAKCVGTEWSYTNKLGQPASLFSPLDDSTIITSIDVTKPVSYRSLFLPENRAIDTFYTDPKSL